MKTTTLILSAIIATLPFTAMAYDLHTVNTPAAVPDNGTVTVSIGDYYQLTDIGEHDDEHIATTAYVKGAYNDTIAAINWVSGRLGGVSELLDDAFVDMSNQRVTIYTTWDTDDTKKITLSTAD